jgi:hypothetical protein
MAAGIDLQWENLRPDSVLERRIANAFRQGDRMK